MYGSASMSTSARWIRSSMVCSGMCSFLSMSGGVVGIDVNVLGRQVAAPRVTGSIAGAEVDRDVDARLRERNAHEVVVDLLRRAAIEYDDTTDRHAAAVEREGSAAATQCRDDAAPVGIATVHRRFHERALRDDPCRNASLIAVGGAIDGDAEMSCRALGIRDELLGE